MTGGTQKPPISAALSAPEFNDTSNGSPPFATGSKLSGLPHELRVAEVTEATTVTVRLRAMDPEAQIERGEPLRITVLSGDHLGTGSRLAVPSEGQRQRVALGVIKNSLAEPKLDPGSDGAAFPRRS